MTTLAVPTRRMLAQAGRFCLVGGSGYVVNLAIFAATSHAGASHRLAATLAFLVAVCNNYVWNRRWTFDAAAGAARGQAARFMLVSLVGFGCSLVVLELLVSGLGVTEIAAQATAVAVTTPLSFLGNRLWTFRVPRSDHAEGARVSRSRRSAC